MSPLVFVGQTEFGQVSKFSHIWAYKSLDHRAETRKAAMAQGVWPPPSSGPSNLVSQENKILLGAAFSPLK